jgi:transcription elongation factor Elf1
MPEIQTLLTESKSLCTAHVCPHCGQIDHVTAERVFIGSTTVTLCHCRACGHSWHAPAEPAPA